MICRLHEYWNHERNQHAQFSRRDLWWLLIGYIVYYQMTVQTFLYFRSHGYQLQVIFSIFSCQEKILLLLGYPLIPIVTRYVFIWSQIFLLRVVQVYTDKQVNIVEYKLFEICTTFWAQPIIKPTVLISVRIEVLVFALFTCYLCTS